MKVTKDIYLYITKFADDKTVVNMLSINKRYNSFFKKLLIERYPAAIPFKSPDKTWRFYYKECIYYVQLLENDDDYKYTQNAKQSPRYYYGTLSKMRRRNFYRSYRDVLNKQEFLLLFAIEKGDIDLLKYMVIYKDVSVNTEDTLNLAAMNGNIEIFKYLIRQGARIQDIRRLYHIAIANKNNEIIEYLSTLV